jgi:hypothetical protein
MCLSPEETAHLILTLFRQHQKGFLQRNTEGIVRSRVEISYSPRFIGRGNNLTAAPVSLQTRRYI